MLTVRTNKIINPWRLHDRLFLWRGCLIEGNNLAASNANDCEIPVSRLDKSDHGLCPHGPVPKMASGLLMGQICHPLAILASLKRVICKLHPAHRSGNASRILEAFNPP